MIVLDEGRVHAMRREGISAKGLGKETPQIAMPSGRQQQVVRNFQTFNFHGRILIEFPVFYEGAGTRQRGYRRQRRVTIADNISLIKTRAESACLSNER
jgi:hypothetical protein